MLHYYSSKLGTITIVQQRGDEVKPRKFKIDIRQGNCLAVFVYVYKEEHPQNPKLPWVHQLVTYFNDERSLKYSIKCNGEKPFENIFSAKKIEKVRLNLFYKESKVLLKYMVRNGLKVECYYKEEKA